MMIGASTANLYPMLTEEALDTLLGLGFRSLEVFLNTESEIAPGFLRLLRDKADAAGARIVSVHPFISGLEPYLLFSAYERRFRDGLDLYARIFEAAAFLRAELVIMHGDKAQGVMDSSLSLYPCPCLWRGGIRAGGERGAGIRPFARQGDACLAAALVPLYRVF